MRKKKTRPTGSVFAQRQEVVPIPVIPENSAEIIKGLEIARNPPLVPWGVMAGVIEGARQEYRELEEKLKVEGVEFNAYNAHFKVRETLGWYLRRIDTFARAAESAIKSGNSWAALEYALLVGEALGEVKANENWGPVVIAALKTKERQRAGAIGNRKHARELRYQLVNEKLENGGPKTEAFRSVAKRLGVSFSTVRADYYLQRKEYGH